MPSASPVPNPFNPRTTIRYTLPHAATVQLSVYNVGGRLVAQLAGGAQEAGEHETSWNGRDSRGLNMSSGVYLVRLQSGGEVRVRKVALLK